MFQKVITIALALFLYNTAVSAQEKAPLLKGKMTLSIKNGTMDCDFKLVDMPHIADYTIILNAGMNIRYIRNMEDNYSFAYERIYNDTVSDEGFQYYIPDNTGKGKVIRDGFQFSYVGKFPVIADSAKATDSHDWKGNIAFNGYSVRADGRQTGWYPVLYDIAKKKRYYKVRYDIEINCSDCNTIYVNGNAPLQSKKAHFKSDIPTELMLFAGNYKVDSTGGTYFLNPDISEAQMKDFGIMTNKFKKYYEEKLGVAYKYNITYIHTTPISKYNAWLFVSYPTIVNIGRGKYGMKSFFERGDWFKPFMAHELAHYYYGTYKEFNSELGDMFSEACAEYLAMKVTKDFFTDSIYNAKVNQKIESMKDFHPVPFAKIKSQSDYEIRDLYVYNYATLVFLAMEKEIGTDKMWAWMRSLLQTQTDVANYAFLEQTLKSVVGDEKTLQRIKDRYFTDSTSVGNAIAIVSEK